MGKKKNRKKKNVRAEPVNSVSQAFLLSSDFEDLCAGSYTRLSDNPEIRAGVDKIADLISSMTIHLMQNTENGDIRIKNQLSRKMDISPNKWMTRKTFISVIVRTLLLEGDGNAIVYPRLTPDGLIDSLEPIEPYRTSFVAEQGFGYKIYIDGVPYDPDRLCHFVMNPSPDYPWKGKGYRLTLKEVAKNLKQAAETKNGFMSSKWKPSLIVQVDASTEELANPIARNEMAEKYLETAEKGEPWIIPSEFMKVESVKPLSLTDLAIADSVTLDKKTVASILSIPSFLLGVGTFNKDEWNNFISTRIKTICNAIEQELTRKILIHLDWYFRMNVRSLFAYDIQTLANVGQDMYTRGLMRGNEVRDWISLPPLEGLDELVILENYIPKGMIGDQKKLNQEEE